MPECPVCYEDVDTVPFKGCTHGTCPGCRRQLASMPQHEVHPFGESIQLPVRFFCLSCPLCRAVEPSPITPYVFGKLCAAFPDAPRMQLETELFRDSDGTFYYTSRRKGNVTILPEEGGVWSLLFRVPSSLRSDQLMCDDKDLTADPAFFLAWDPIQHKYAPARRNLKKN